MDQSVRKVALLQVNHLCLSTLECDLLRDINWHIEEGQNWAILGSNGCGKTLLLSTIMLYRTPTKGSIALLGQRYEESDWFELRKRIGLVSHVLNSRIPKDELAWLTVASGSLGQLGYWERDDAPDEKGALRCLGKMGIRRIANREWAVLSQGERQKVLIARALMARPEFLILDEPCNGLDPVARESLLQSLQKILRRKNAPPLVLVTHHVEEILPEITHVLLLKDGKVLAKGPKREILNSSLLSKAYGASITVQKSRKNQRWYISLIEV